TPDKDIDMLRIYTDCLLMARDAARVAKLITRHDADLARQLRRAATSAPLNVAEGAGLSGGNRRLRYETAVGSAREVRACYDVAEAMDYIKPVGDDIRDRLDKICATLSRITR